MPHDLKPAACLTQAPFSLASQLLHHELWHRAYHSINPLMVLDGCSSLSARGMQQGILDLRSHTGVLQLCKGALRGGRTEDTALSPLLRPKAGAVRQRSRGKVSDESRSQGGSEYCH